MILKCTFERSYNCLRILIVPYVILLTKVKIFVSLFFARRAIFIFLFAPIILPASNDSLKTKSEERKNSFVENGTFSAGYEYGLIPSYSYDTYPLGGYKSDGQLALNALGLPINASYFYSSLKNVYG